MYLAMVIVLPGNIDLDMTKGVVKILKINYDEIEMF